MVIAASTPKCDVCGDEQPEELLKSVALSVAGIPMFESKGACPECGQKLVCNFLMTLGHAKMPDLPIAELAEGAKMAVCEQVLSIVRASKK